MADPANDNAVPDRVERHAHEFRCAGCNQDVWSAVHWGPVDLCMMCQAMGPELHRRVLALTEPGRG